MRAPFHVEQFAVCFTEAYEDEIYQRDLLPGGDAWDAYCAGDEL